MATRPGGGKQQPGRARTGAPSADLPELKPIQRQVIDYVMNHVALGDYGNCCSVEAMAEAFGKSAGRFRTTLNKLADQGYLTISGEVFPWVYPTVEALRRQDESLSREEAQGILNKIKRSGK